MNTQIMEERSVTYVKYKRAENKQLYSKYAAMKARCYRATSAKYKNYGERGIVVCDEWKGSFDSFAEWAYTHGYSDEMTIERIDVNGNYCPENCIWISAGEQAYNKTNTIWVDYRGERIQLSVLCKRLGVNYQSIHFRINHMGMSVEEAFNTPWRENVTDFAKKCHEHNMPIKVVRDRIRKLGWDEERALNTPVKQIKKRSKERGSHAQTLVNETKTL